MNKTLLVVSTFTAALGIASPATSHVTLEQREATIGGPTKLTFRVPHGCEDQPTTTLRVLIPEGFIAAKPMPKPGWTLDVSQGDYAKAHDYFHGVKLSKGTKEIVWKGSLPNDYYDEFVVSGFVGRDFKADAILYFPVVQECPNGGVHRWVEVPAAGQNGSDLKEPAPGIKLMPRK
jgi:uncharacterized protein YcnI